jgi:hypothetical protein
LKLRRREQQKRANVSIQKNECRSIWDIRAACVKREALIEKGAWKPRDEMNLTMQMPNGMVHRAYLNDVAILKPFADMS